MWISKEFYNDLLKTINDKEDIITELQRQGREYARRNFHYKKELERAEKISNRHYKDLERTTKMLWHLQSECDEKDIYRKLCHKSQLSNALKLKNKELEKELKEAYETISQLETERKDLEIKNKNQSALIVEQSRKLYKKEDPAPLNDETLGAFYE